MTSSDGWGIESNPYPEDDYSSATTPYINARWDQCTGCRLCEQACAVFHDDTLNTDFSRIRIERHFTPLPKGVQTVCVQCEAEERECQQACPLDPPAIGFERGHIKVDTERCLGWRCGRCVDACEAGAIRYRPPEEDAVMACDLCDDGETRRPRCVDICPSGALEYVRSQFPRYLERLPADEKACHLATRFTDLPMDDPGTWEVLEP